jgi:alkylation response protein AidB-like acyl-CoA dehydrogenase
VSLDLAFDDAQLAIEESVAAFCRERGSEDLARSGRFSVEAWRGLGELGVLALASPEGEGGAAELAAAAGALGAAGLPGPLAATAFAGAVLPAEALGPVVAGEALVALGAPPLLPWAPLASVFLEIAGERVYRARPAGPVTPLETLAGEPWGRMALEREAELADLEGGLARFHVTLAAQLAGAGHRLHETGVEHARTRRQFGRAIGEFQAVAHPLADCAMRLHAASALVRLAAFRLDAGDARAPGLAAAARLSAGRAALATAHVVHQTLGAVGVTLEGPAFHLSRRVRQLVSLPPGPDAARARVPVPLEASP